MTPEQEAARAAALNDKLSPRERKLLAEAVDDVPTLDDYEDDRRDPFLTLLDDLYEEDDLLEEFDDELDYSR